MSKLLWLCLWTLWIPCVCAQPLSLKDLIAEALRSNAELRLAQKRVEAARPRARVEGALADPTLSVGYASSGGPLPGQGIGREPIANIGVMITQDLPYPGKRRLMAGIATKEADAEVQQYRALERSVAARVSRAYHKLYHANTAIEVMTHGRDTIGQFVELAQVRYSTGQATQQEILRAQTQVAVMETRIVKMRQDAAMAKAELNVLLGRTPRAVLGDPAHEEPRALTLDLDQLSAAVGDNSPFLEREQKMAEARQLGVQLARKNFKPDFAVSGGYYNMGTMPDMYQFRLDIRLPARGAKQRAELTEKVQQLEQARRSYEATDQDTRWKLNELYISAQTSWRLIEIYGDTLLPQAELTVESAINQYGTGSLDASTVLMNLMTSIEQDELYHEEMLNYFNAVIGLEELTGLELL